MAANILLLTGTTASGKTYLTERVVAIEYDVLTEKLDSFYYRALEAAGVPKPEGGQYSVYKEAHRLRDDTHASDVRDRFDAKLRELLVDHVRRAKQWKVTPVLEGYTLGLPDEARTVAEVAREVLGPKAEVARLHVRPTLEDWNRFRREKFQRMKPGRPVEDANASYYERRMVAPEPVDGIQDAAVTDADELRERLEALGVRRHRWYQRISFPPVETPGPSDAREKADTVLDRDVVGKSILDLCCATGVVSLVLKSRGGRKGVGIELDGRRYAKSLELQKTLIRHAPDAPRVDFRYGDAIAALTEVGRFDTVIMFGAIHYFEDYEMILRRIADVAREAVYIEFTFAEGEHDTATDPGAIRPWTRRKTKTVIHMGDPATIGRIVTRAMPEFTLEARVPISPPGRASQREVWRLRRATG